MKNLRLVRMFQWPNGADAWITITLVFRLAIHFWRFSRLRFRNKSANEPLLVHGAVPAFSDEELNGKSRTIPLYVKSS